MGIGRRSESDNLSLVSARDNDGDGPIDGCRNLCEPAAKSFRPNAAQLMQAKRRDDPDDLFRSAISLPVPGTVK
jgi:hypothetical protein